MGTSYEDAKNYREASEYFKSKMIKEHSLPKSSFNSEIIHFQKTNYS